MRMQLCIWKRTFRSAFPAKAGIQFSALNWPPAFAGDAVERAEGNCLHQCEALGEVDRRVFAARRRGRRHNIRTRITPPA